MRKNPLLRSILVVYTFWYLLSYAAIAWLRGYPFHFVMVDYAVSVIAMLLGAGAGLYLTLGLAAIDLYWREKEVKTGDARRGARVSLGKLPVSAADEPQPAIKEVAA